MKKYRIVTHFDHSKRGIVFSVQKRTFMFGIFHLDWWTIASFNSEDEAKSVIQKLKSKPIYP